MVKEPERNMVITENDRKALILLYHNGILAKDHLKRLVWGNRTADNRLTKLFAHGYVQREPYTEKNRSSDKVKRKYSTMYSLELKAIKYLSAYIEGQLRTPFDNKPGEDKVEQKQKRREYFQMAELWCQMLEQGIIKTPLDWIPSRLAKEKYELRPPLPFHSIIKRENGFDVFFFIDDYMDGRRPGKIKEAISELSINGAQRFFVISDNSKLLKILQSFLLEYPEQEIYCIGCGTRKNQSKDYSGILKPYIDPDIFYRELKDRLEPRYGDIELIPSSLSEPSEYKFIHNGETIQVTELISGSIKNLAKLQLKGTAFSTPQLLYAYLPGTGYYHLIKHLLPENRGWLRVVIRDRAKGDDIFSAS